jgi:hypothetical protein
MLPVYDAIQLVKIIDEDVGHNKPWVVLANTTEGIQSFIVKLFDFNSDHLNHFITKEVLGSVLASEFDFSTPKCALINLSNEIAVLCKNEADFQQYERTNNIPQFATVMCEGVSLAKHNLPKHTYTKKINLDSLYAFDNLIRNHDRSIRKPNLLLSKEEAILIDHEFSFDSIDIEDINDLSLLDRFTKYHFFYNHLTRAKKNTKSNYFDEFTFYLNNLNLNVLTVYFNQLEQLGYDTNRVAIMNWLTLLKNNLPIFVNKLKGSL